MHMPVVDVVLITMVFVVALKREERFVVMAHLVHLVDVVDRKVLVLQF